MKLLPLFLTLGIVSFGQSTMKESIDIKKELEALDQYLRNKRPAFYAQLNKPLAENEIQALEARFKRRLPDDLRMLYRWKNGQSGDCTESFVNNSTFMPLEQALSDAAELTSMIGTDFEIVNWWNKDWIPLFHNGGGDHICYDLAGTFNGKPGQLLEFWHADNDRNIIAPGLASFLKKLNDYYTTTPKEKFDEYFDLANLEGFPIRHVLK